MRTWRTRRGRLTALGTVLAATLSGAAAGPASASSAPVVIPDGEYVGVISGSSTMDFGGMAGSATFQGEMRFSVDAGAVTGTYSLGGTSVLSGPDMNGTGRYETTGSVSGPATGPVIEAGVTTIKATITIGGMTQEQTMDMPGGEESTLQLLGGDCGVIVARWEVADAGMAGNGTVLIAPTIDMSPDDTEYLSVAQTLQADVDDYIAAIGSGTAAALDLGALVERADALRQSMRRNEECGLRPADDLVGLMLQNTIGALIGAALAHPESVPDIELGMLTTAGADHGLVGADAPAGGGAMADALVAEWSRRLDGFVATGDSSGISLVEGAAEVLGDAGLRDDAAAAAAAVD